jgi:hypothetical protein
VVSPFTIEMSEEEEYKIDSCVECCVRDNDFSEKKVYQCKLCERWFCEKHIEPRLAFIKDLKAIEKSPEIRALYYTEVEGKEGHPDFVYSRIKLMELDMEEKRRNELIKEALDRMNGYYHRILPKSVREKRTKKAMTSEGDLHFIREEKTEEISRENIHQEKREDILREKRFNVNVKGLGFSIGLFLIGLFLLLYSSRDIYLVFIIPFIPLPIPFWVVGMVLIVVGTVILGASF